MSLTNLSQNVIVASLGTICLGLLIREWLSLRASWTELTARGQLFTSLMFLSLMTIILFALQWALALGFVRAIATDMVLDDTSIYRADSLDALDAMEEEPTRRVSESDTR
jgi:hypothetical protein